MISIEIDRARVPALGVGTWGLAGADCARVVADALAMGYRHIDTAQRYRNEDAVGQALARSSVPRDEVWLTTKLDIGNATRATARPSFEQSLRDLRTDYVDLLMIHWPEPGVPCEESLAVMAELRAAGLVRHLGVCNFPPSLLARACAATTLANLQVEYHVYLSQDELYRTCVQRGMFLTAYAPLARGRVAADPVLAEVAAGYAKTPAQVALRWLVQQPRVAAIPKASSVARLRENLDVFDFALSDADLAAIAGLRRDLRVVNPAHAPDWER
jgi:2,5-diketo-D-gluconate reductase B